MIVFCNVLILTSAMFKIKTTCQILRLDYLINIVSLAKWYGDTFKQSETYRNTIYLAKSLYELIKSRVCTDIIQIY